MRRLTVLAASLALTAPAMAQQTDRPDPPETDLVQPDVTIERPETRPTAPRSMPEPDPLEPEFNLRDSALGQGETECSEDVSGASDAGEEDAPSFTLRTRCREDAFAPDDPE